MSVEFNSIPIEKKEITVGLKKGHTRHLLQAPSKVLSIELSQHPDSQLITADTYIANRTEKRGWRRKPVPPVPGATTQLFSEAQKIMQETADEAGLPVVNSFVTRDLRMRAWALAAEGGAGIFKWDTVIDNGPGEAFNAFSYIYPNSKETDKE